MKKFISNALITRQHKACLFTLCTALSTTVHAGIWDNVPVPEPSGPAYEGIRETIDNIAIETLKEADIPGLTVAVSQNGRLIYNRGFGFSNWETQEPMSASDRAPIGSTSKVLTTMAMLHWLENNSALPIEDAVRGKVYGSTGILSDHTYNKAFRQGIRRHYPVVGIGIGQNNRTITWFSDGKYTVGNSTDLGAYRQARDFALPEDKKMLDLLGIAVGGADNRVYSWYRDGTYSIGTASDLGEFSNGTKFNSRRKDLIVAIAADTDTNTFYAYHHDGKVTSGDSAEDLTNRWSKDYVTSGDQQNRYDIVGVARSNNDVMVTWFSDGNVSKGNATNLAYTWTPRSYSRRGVPDSIAQWERAYKNIEVQHLLSHTSGLTRSGHYDQARIKYNLQDYENSYRYSNQYVLSTRPLLFKPGTDYKYSNQGMGLVGHLIDELSGMDWYTYMYYNILSPSSAFNIAPVGMYNDPEIDSRSHTVSSDGSVSVKPVVTKSHPGSAAGSLKASAGDLLTLLVATDGLPNHADVLSDSTIELMEKQPFPETSPGSALGWHIHCQDTYCDRKRLSHNGVLPKGGASFMAKYSKYVKFSSYIDEVSVAVVSNSSSAGTKNLKKLSNTIASEVAKVSTPQFYDILTPGPVLQ